MGFQEYIKADFGEILATLRGIEYATAGGYSLTTGTGSNCKIKGVSPTPVSGVDMSPFFVTGNSVVPMAWSRSSENPDLLLKIPLVDIDGNPQKYVVWYGYFTLGTNTSYMTIKAGISSDGTYAGMYTSGTYYNMFNSQLEPYMSTSSYRNYNFYAKVYYTIRNDEIIAGITFINDKGDQTTDYAFCSSGSQVFAQSVNLTKLCNQLSLTYEEMAFSSEFGEPSTEGGYTSGTFDDSSDTISLPSSPSMGVTSVGFINVYAPTQGELVQFGSELFPNLSFTPVSQSGSPSSVTDALVAMAQVLVDFGNQIPQMIDMYINSNLINYVIDCHVIPVSPQKQGTSPVKVGFKTFTPTPSVVTSDYVDFNCGTLNVGEYYANFIDYLPYTRAKLYLPFVGFIDLAPEYWQSGSLNVTYRFNIIDGSFVAFVKSTSSKSKLSDSVIGQFGGNACIHIPITGLNYASMVSGIVGAMSPLLPSATGGVGDALVNSANAIANNKPNLQQSNGYNATTSFLTVRYPYLLIERSVSNFSRKYAEEDGIPSNITLDFSSLSGLTKATMLHLDGISGATEDDLDEIASLLSEGVIL